MISGYYKSYCSSTNSHSGDKEFVIDLQENKTLNTVYFSHRYDNRNNSYRCGTAEIRLGDDSAAYNSNNSVVWAALYDGGFFPIGTTFNGRYLTIRRIHLATSIS